MVDDTIILTDCDGVLLDWEHAFDQWMAENGYGIKVHAVYDIGIKYVANLINRFYSKK